jgi:hypothetical protein
MFYGFRHVATKRMPSEFDGLGMVFGRRHRRMRSWLFHVSRFMFNGSMGPKGWAVPAGRRVALNRLAKRMSAQRGAKTIES